MVAQIVAQMVQQMVQQVIEQMVERLELVAGQAIVQIVRLLVEIGIELVVLVHR